MHGSDSTITSVFDAEILTGLPEGFINMDGKFSGDVKLISQLPDVGPFVDFCRSSRDFGPITLMTASAEVNSLNKTEPSVGM
jgi:hypothetical protein